MRFHVLGCIQLSFSFCLVTFLSPPGEISSFHLVEVFCLLPFTKTVFLSVKHFLCINKMILRKKIKPIIIVTLNKLKKKFHVNFQMHVLHA